MAILLATGIYNENSAKRNMYLVIQVFDRLHREVIPLRIAGEVVRVTLMGSEELMRQSPAKGTIKVAYMKGRRRLKMRIPITALLKEVKAARRCIQRRRGAAL